ncbi:hypothetical protein [Paracidovorax cattleyae]|uniref:Beta-ketoacyl synthase, N-terminal domain n=1 Tax=Paracidovorax cattleyae TaxID=80868 RepID=A0A1H0WN90_9BURK|nr:hypothetical protein [Paracidovorax cattleyae]AVS75404.1 hypothetical protein C8240_16705 [Paracidovorax cattleyae]SDP92088.1 hypothetical protein SAMN04489708_14425 [Paracidovorax cattleyae]
MVSSSPASPTRLWRIEHCGAVTSAGTRAWQSAASWVGLQKRFRKSAWPAVGPHPITTAPCPEITGDATGIPRLARLLGAALADLGASLLAAGSSVRLPAPDQMVLALPAWMSDADCAEVWRLSLAELARWAGPGAEAPWTTLPCRFVRGGHTAGFAGLYELQGNTAPGGTALLMAVDSLLDPPRLARAYAEGALLTDRTPEGCVASEAAACLWLASVPDTHASSERHLVLHAPALAESSSPHRRPPQPPDTGALEQVLRNALAQAGWQGEHVGHGISDFDGSAWRALAQVTARVRAAPDLEPTDWEPAAVIGQVGAATGPVHWALAAERAWHDERPPNSVLSWALDEGSGAAAVALERTVTLPGRRDVHPATASGGAAVDAVRTYSSRFLQHGD